MLAKDPDLQFDNQQIYTHNRKLEKLAEFEEALIKEDKSKKENRRGI